MANKKYKDSDILAAMSLLVDNDSVVYGANGHYSIGAYYDITKVSSVFGDKDYNSKGNIDKAENSDAAKAWKNELGELDESLEKALWLNW